VPLLSLWALVAFLKSVDMFRLAVEGKPWKEDDQQSGEHVPGGSSCQLHGQLQLVVGL